MLWCLEKERVADMLSLLLLVGLLLGLVELGLGSLDVLLQLLEPLGLLLLDVPGLLGGLALGEGVAGGTAAAGAGRAGVTGGHALRDGGEGAGGGGQGGAGDGAGCEAERHRWWCLGEVGEVL